MGGLPHDLDYIELVQRFPKYQQLIHQFQIATEVWAREIKSTKTADASFYAQELFFLFLDSGNNKRVIGNIADITPSVMRNYLNHLGGITSSLGSIRRHYSSITAILRVIQRSIYSELTEIGKPVKFPVPTREKPDQGGIPALDHRSFNELVLVLQSHFDCIKNIPNKVQQLLNDGQPTLDEILEDKKTRLDPWDELPNVLWHYHHKYLAAPSARGRSNTKRSLVKRGWEIETLERLYQQNWEMVKDIAQNPLSAKAKSLDFTPKQRKEDQDRTLSLVLKEYYQKYNDFPLNWSVDEAHDFLRTTGHFASDSRYRSHPAHELWKYVKHLESPLFRTKFNGLGALFFYIHPTLNSVSVCLYLLKVQTGWNLSVLLGLEFGTDFESLFHPCPVSQDYVLLVGEKSRGKLSEKYHRTKKNNKYGAYRILKLLWEFGKELRKHTNSKSPWIYLRLKFPKDSEMTSEMSDNSHQGYMVDLCRDKLIHSDDGEPLNKFAFESIRKNLAEIEDEVSDHDLKKLSSMLQNSPEVAAKHYRSKENVDKRLRTVQGIWVQHFTYFQGSFKHGNSLVKQHGDESLIDPQESTPEVQIITTDGITPISLCKNPYKPDWHGHKTSVGDSESCSYFNGCSNCSQCVVFTETLPYIHRRLQILNQLRKKMNIGDWENSYHIEWYAWKEVLEQWPERNEVLRAEAESHLIRLPIRPQLYSAIDRT